ncbi:uncharacterized protein LOC129951021 [Eupeodes corollae]|uniref:uncharacterized protein LOC129951021 n=1 Tax=Eupeodes corollae TaxID=290404 RepID=UPI002493B320|nr:uncharacterized protein LOC129951021 [Eupeodes corollae]
MSEFNSDELIAPSWMNEQFFQEVLRNCECEEKLLVQNVKLAPASAKGDHYASIMFRAIVTYSINQSENKSKSMIIKTMPEIEGNKKELFEKSFIFETEIGMYSKTIPKFHEELRNIGDDTILGAKALYYSLQPRKVIVFEDIALKGYGVLSERMANMEEAKMAFLKLSKWHALSYKLASEGDTNVSSYCESFFNRNDLEKIPFMTGGIKNFIDKIDTIDELRKYVPHLRRLAEDLLKKCIASTKAYRDKSPKGIFVLNHGDFHFKNIMVKRNGEKKLVDVMLIDFQMCSFGPAILDVMYGIYMLLDPKLRSTYFDEIMYFYCSNFIDTLKKLKFQGEIPKITDFYIEMYCHPHWELFLLTTFLPLWYGLIDKQFGELDEILNSDEERAKLYDNPNYLEDVLQTLPKMFNQGYLE